MNATKRKFNTLLNGLGNKPSNASTSSSKSEETMPPPRTAPQTTSAKDRESLDTQAKKRRPNYPTPSISTVPSTLGSITTLSESSTFYSRQKKAESTRPSTDSGPSSETAPSFAPWDRPAFLRRLKTFATLTDWFPKPERVNEVEWAKRGWVCGKRERVRCVSCNVELLVKLNKKVLEDGTEEGVYVAANIEEQVVDKYAELIITGHAENCLWRARGCDDTIFKLSLNNPINTLQTIRERYTSLAALGSSLPYPQNMHPPPSFDYEKTLSYLPKDFFPASTPINKVAIMMALFGWGAMQNHTHSAAECTACFRRLGLWLFKSKEVSPTGEELVGAAMNHLDVVQEHRDYCPWKNPDAQSGPSKGEGKEKLAAWEVVLRVLRNDYLLKNPEAAKKQVAREKEVAEWGEGDEAEVKSIREEKDKEWSARLRRVKSMFNTKDKKKQNRMSAPAPKSKDGL